MILLTNFQFSSSSYNKVPQLESAVDRFLLDFTTFTNPTMYQYCNKRKRIIKVENDNYDVLDDQNNFNQKLPQSFDFGRNSRRGPGYSSKPFKKCILCDAELSSEKTVSDHVKGRRHTKKVEKRRRDMKYGIIPQDDECPEWIIEVPVYQFGRIKIPAGPAAWATGTRDQPVTQARKRRRFG